MVAIGEEDTFQRVRSVADLRRPVQTTVNSVNDGSFRPDGPAFSSIDKLYVKEISGHTRVLTVPGPASINGVEDLPTAAYSPTNAIINERSGVKSDTLNRL